MMFLFFWFVFFFWGGAVAVTSPVKEIPDNIGCVPAAPPSSCYSGMYNAAKRKGSIKYLAADQRPHNREGARPLTEKAAIIGFHREEVVVVVVGGYQYF